MSDSKNPSVFAASPIFHVNGEGWYFDRGGRFEGPFVSREKLIAVLQRSRYQGPRVHRRPEQGWYVRAREGLKGPFETQTAAEAFLEQLKTQSGKRRSEVWA